MFSLADVVSSSAFHDFKRGNLDHSMPANHYKTFEPLLSLT